MSIINTGDTLVRTEERTSNGAVFQYRLTVRESDRVASFGIPLYSVAVEMTDRGNRTEACVRDCFSDAERAFVFFNKVVDHLATPIDLPYILEDERK